ncbi:hypothetical protein CRG98_019194 [Punica granatum]|uniref:Uncharacterized protein n=1 Tax=Punica granatum TaxID=22663 RepID=A0A2I0JVR6_PUNGR|nr:hypothetical protein CRG98_019194 [Punica granatum]
MSCTVERLSDRDHLFTGESEGCEKPLEREGTTRHCRERKWHVEEVRCTGPVFGRRLFVRVSGLPGAQLGKASADVRGTLLLSRSPCPHVRAFAPDCRVKNSSPSLSPSVLVSGVGGPKWGADS